MKRWLKYMKPYKRFFILGPVCMVGEVVGEIVMPKLYASIINTGVAGQDAGHIILICLLMVLCAVAMIFLGVGGAYFASKASVSFAADIRRDVFAHIQDFSFANIDKFSTGSLITRLTNDVTQVMNFVNMLMRMCLRAPGMLIGALIMAIIMKPDLALVLAVTVPLILIVQFILIKLTFPRFTRMQEKIDVLNTDVQESLTNVRVVKSFVREDFEQEKFDHANGELKDAGLGAMKLMVSMMPLMMLIMNLTSVFVVWFGGNQVIGGHMLVGDLSAFITYINQILMSLMMVSIMFIISSRSLASGKRIAEVLDEVPDISDAGAKRTEKRVEQGDIEFKNVSFRYYKNSEGKVLDDINLKIGHGQTVGIIGSTGCGKSTLVSLIPRLYDADEGEVLVDGVNVRDYSLRALRDGIGVALQKNVLFSGTIAENLRWGDQEATDAEVMAASESAQAAEFVEKMPEGYDAALDQGGTNISGGQKQRLCIARALLKKPKILILDDSTSAVDTATEAKIRAAFKDELKDATKLIIAQRISSVMDADIIIVMDDGRITGTGTHAELLKSCAEYREICESQLSGKEAV